MYMKKKIIAPITILCLLTVLYNYLRLPDYHITNSMSFSSADTRDTELTVIVYKCWSRKMRYKRYRFGQWYAPAMWLGGKVYFCAQPVGQAATSTMTPDDATRLGGEVGDAINASGLVHARVYYELNPETGKSEFVGRERMMQLLAGYPTLHAEFEKETSESAEVIGKYLRALRPLITNH